MRLPNRLNSRWITEDWKNTNIEILFSGYLLSTSPGLTPTRCCRAEVQYRLQLLLWSGEGPRAQNLLTGTSSRF